MNNQIETATVEISVEVLAHLVEVARNAGATGIDLGINVEMIEQADALLMPQQVEIVNMTPHKVDIIQESIPELMSAAGEGQREGWIMNEGAALPQDKVNTVAPSGEIANVDLVADGEGRMTIAGISGLPVEPAKNQVFIVSLATALALKATGRSMSDIRTIGIAVKGRKPDGTPGFPVACVGLTAWA